MRKKDFIIDQIEQIGKVLAKIILEFKNTKNQENYLEAIKSSNSKINIKLKINIENILEKEKKELIPFLKEKIISEKHLEILAEYFVEIANTEYLNLKEKRKYLLKSLELYDIADEIFKTISFDRINKIKKIEELLKDD